jgi:glycosyltransferase involved in cell wall biosynthesis
MARLAVPSTHPPVSSRPSPTSGASSLVEDRPSGQPAAAAQPVVPPLRILMLAPEPFFEPRGTPFSEYHRIKALVEDGHAVDLVTYGYGADVDLPNLRIVRSNRLPLVRRVPIGPSLTKLLLDLLLTVTTLRQARRVRYDAIHSHEEAGVLGVWLSQRLGVPHLYDMHSSLPQQLSNFRFTQSGLIRRAFDAMERRMIGGSRVVITICRELQETVAAMGAGDRAVLIENVMGGDVEREAGPGRTAMRARWRIPATAPLVLYTGTFESYQGLDLLVDASVRLQRHVPDAHVVVVGGSAEQVAREQERASAAGARLVFTGQRPPSEIPHFVDACDVLVSPRMAGTNTPLKIYSYLRSNRPIVATRLVTHTQVLDDTCACLVEPTPDALAAGLRRMIEHPDEARALAAAAAALAAVRYSREAYVARTRDAYARLVAGAGRQPSTALSGEDRGAARIASVEPRVGSPKLP